jgi:DNA-binding LacI/PurR family transcriptional regulator
LEYYMRFVFGAADTARDAGYALTILPSGHGASLNLDGVDGIVLVDALADDSSVEAVLGHSGPVVASERIPHRPDAAVVVVEPDHRAAISELFDHLIAQGAHRPAMIGAGSNSSWGARTADAYLAWCEERGIEPILRQTSFTAPAHVVGAVAGEMLDSEDPPDAIVSCPDGAALGVLDAARDRSILVGRDLLVGGTVDSTPFRYINPGITALDHHAHVVGRRCAEILLQWIQTDSPGDPPGPVKLDLTVRGSSGKRA